MEPYRQTLLEHLARYAYEYRPEGFTLAYGGISKEYLDCKQALSRSEAMTALGALVVERLHPTVVAVGGLTMGADPLSMSASMFSGRNRHPVRWFSVRKEAKKHGRGKLIEGAVEAGECVAIVDDVVTTGSSTIDAITKCRAFQLRVTQVIVLVDREEADGIANIRRAAGDGTQVEAIFTKSEVREEWQRLAYSLKTA